MVSGISLANKSQLLFGFAVTFILIIALSVPWVRTSMLVEAYQIESARQLADTWLDDHFSPTRHVLPGPLPPQLESLASGDADEQNTTADADDHDPDLRITLVNPQLLDPEDENHDQFVLEAYEFFRDHPDEDEHVGHVEVDERGFHRYARALRHSEMEAYPGWLNDLLPAPEQESSDKDDPVRAILLVDRFSEFAESQLLISRVFIVAAGLIGTLLAILVFYLILTKLMFSPVRELRRTAEKVQEGSLTTRSNIRTGDEFEQLSEAFNAMLDRLEHSREELRIANQTLDLRATQIAEDNIALYESNRLKSEFVANVSHELKTPLNAILGFADLLQELATKDGNADPKRMRYLENILSSGAQLREMIEELLDMARIEAGRMELSIAPTSIPDLLEGVEKMLRPQAEKKQINLQVRSAVNVPVIETDPGKLQQILYNFMSNAIKFTPESGRIDLTADRITRQDNSQGVRISVADTGPGIPYDMQDLIFEKFRQVDATHTREYPGTGLGLAICRELAELLGATVSFVSKPGEGATFYVDLPVTYQPQQSKPLMEDMMDNDS